MTETSQGRRSGRRRRIGSGLVAAAVGAGLLIPVTNAAPASAAPVFVAYHERTSAQHDEQWSSLTGQGYRPVSLSVYGDSANPKYAAVWVKKAGVAFAGNHGLTSSNFSATVQERASQGLHPTIITGTGSGSTATFAIVFEKVTGWSGMVAMSPSTFAAESNRQRNAGRILKWVDMYGTATTPLIAAVYGPNPGKIAWNHSVTDNTVDDNATMQAKFNGFMSQGTRLDMMAISPAERHLGVYHDSQLNGGWIAHTWMTPADYQAKFNELTPKGWFPIKVDGGGTSAAPRINAVFAVTESILPRVHTVTGAAVPELASLDTYMKTLLKSAQARSGALAVTRNGKLVYSRGFTYAESGYAATQPTSSFRVASCSKPITSVAAHQLVQEGSLSFQKRVRPLLGLTTPSGGAPADSRLDDVTVDQLLYHAGGWDRGIAGDVVFQDPSAATANNVALPVTKQHVAKYVTAKPMQFNPGENSVYSNYGIGLVGQVIERRRATDYNTAVRNSVFAKLGVSRATIGRSAASLRLPGEVQYQPSTPYVDKAVTSSARPWVGGPYGGWRQENLDAFGGWVMAAPDYAKLLASFDLGDKSPVLKSAMTKAMWSSPPAGIYPTSMSNRTDLLRGWFRTSFNNSAGQPVEAVGHNGSLPGTSCLAMRRADGLSFVLLLNRDVSGFLQFNPHGSAINNLLNGVTSWPTHDLFPSVGISSFS